MIDKAGHRRRAGVGLGHATFKRREVLHYAASEEVRRLWAEALKAVSDAVPHRLTLYTSDNGALDDCCPEVE